MSDDNIIKQKVNSLDSLPPGYEPNLESKWNLLEAGLDEGKKKRVILYWHRVAIAAMLLIIGGGSLLFMNTHSPDLAQQKIGNKQIMKTEIPIQPLAKKEAEKIFVSASGKLTHPVFYSNKMKTVVQSLTIAEQKNEHDSVIKPNELIKDISEIKLVSSSKIKRSRFVELDFNDQPLAPTINWNEPVLASQSIKFKLGISNGTSSGYTYDGRNFKLSKSISN